MQANRSLNLPVKARQSAGVRYRPILIVGSFVGKDIDLESEEVEPERLLFRNWMPR
jgi:hypothetical protein